MRRIFLGLMLLVVASGNAVCAENIGTIRTIMELPDNQIDMGKTMLTIDKMIDPTVNIKANLKKIDSMVAQIQMGLMFQASSMEKLHALQAYLYTANNWNGHQPYEYDFSDPFGHTIQHKLISNYLATKKGNCVSMPFLFIILGQRLGIDVTAATAPNHIFVKYRDDMGNLINLEATSGATPARDVWVRQQTPMTDEAVANGIYLRALSKKETVILAFETVIQDYIQKRQYEKAIEASDMVLGYFPKDIIAMLFKGSTYSHLITEEFEDKYPSMDFVPKEKLARLKDLERNNRLWYDKAMALGWRRPTEAYETQYKEIVGRAKSIQ